MAVINSKFLVKTNGNNDIVDLTHRIKLIVRKNKINNALVNVHTPFSNASIGIMEYDPGIVLDFFNLINKIVPDNEFYAHNAEWNDNFAQTYIKSLLIGNSVSLPFINGDFELDRFQKILLFDFNSKQGTRSVIIQIIY